MVDSLVSRSFLSEINGDTQREVPHVQNLGHLALARVFAQRVHLANK